MLSAVNATLTKDGRGYCVMLMNLKRLRKEKGISQQTLGEAVDLTQQSINKYENQRVEPDLATLMKIADFFETSVDFLIGHTAIKQRYEPTSSYQLNEEEANFINKYRRLNEKERQSLLMVLDNYLDKWHQIASYKQRMVIINDKDKHRGIISGE